MRFRPSVFSAKHKPHPTGNYQSLVVAIKSHLSATTPLQSYSQSSTPWPFSKWSLRKNHNLPLLRIALNFNIVLGFFSIAFMIGNTAVICTFSGLRVGSVSSDNVIRVQSCLFRRLGPTNVHTYILKICAISVIWKLSSHTIYLI